MDLKQKFKDLLNLSKTDEDEDADLSAINCSIEEYLGLSKNEIKLLSRNPEGAKESRMAPEDEQEILDTIEAAYVDESCDGGRYQLQKIRDSLQDESKLTDSGILLNHVRSQRQVLGTQLTAITHKLFAVILQKQADCSTELTQVLDLQDKLDTALGTCSSGRLQLSRARQNLTMSSLGLLAHQRKRHHLLEIHRSLRAIHTLEQMGQRVGELLHQPGDEDYAAAIQLLMEGRHAAETYKHFHCVAQLTSRLQDTLEMAEEQLDVGLAKCCQEGFDPALYSKLQLAFTLLGKQSAALDQLNLHLSTVLHQRSLAVVIKFATGSQSSRTSGNPPDYSKLQFQDLCRLIDSSSFMACFQELCTCLWNVTITYHLIHQWHAAGDGEKEPKLSNELEQKLLHGRSRLWQDVQNKVRTFLLSSDLWHFHIDEFLRVLDTVDRLVEVGTQFCAWSESDILRDCIRQQSVNYFRTFHRGRLDELRVFLENESWEHCPVRSNFSVFHLTEFQFLHKIPNPSDERNTHTSSAEQFYAPGAESPFSGLTSDSNRQEDITGRANSTEDSNDNQDDEDGKPLPLLANTTLSVLRLFGRYIHFMQLLKTIAFDVLICLNQLFDFYLLAIHRFFGMNPVEFCDAALTPKLRIVLNRIGDMMILKSGEELVQANNSEVAAQPDGTAASSSGSLAGSDRVPCPQISPALQLDHSNQLYGLRARLVAAESVVFLARQMELLKPNLLTLIPPAREHSLQQFVIQTMAVAQDLRLPVYASVACRCLDADAIVGHMSRVQWEIKEVMSQHNNYIDLILQSLSEFSANIHRVCYGTTLPPEAYNILWDQILRLCYRILLEGFAMTRKCTNEGRALMQLDLRQFQLKVEGLTRLRPLPDAALVETYIKAFYLPESSLDQWVRQHTEYSPKHLMNLLQCVSQANKKTRLSLTALMEELDLSRR